MKKLEGTVKNSQNSQNNHNPKQTVLVIQSDAAVLVLLRGILAEDYRVLLASDAESAVRLAMLEDVPIDLVLMGRNTLGIRNSRELQRRLTAIRPDLAILSMVGSVEDQIIRIRMVRIPKAHLADDFMVLVRRALSMRNLRCAPAYRAPTDLPRQEPAKTERAPQVARAGSTMQ